MGDINFRLPQTPRAERYIYTVAPDLENQTFSAKGRAELRLSAPTRTIVLHGVELDVTYAAVGVAMATVSADPASQTLVFSFPTELEAVVSLQLEWSGKFHHNLRGLYLAGQMAVTQFEAADARRVFPCLDEPGFKAVWELTLEAPEHLSVISNGGILSETPIDGERKRVVFAPTPRISSYLVAFVVGPLVASKPIRVGEIPLRTWAAPEKSALLDFAHRAAATILPSLEAYFGQPYAFGKLDQVAVPDFEAGAMENAGCITYREIVLLVDEQRAPLNVRKRVAEVIAHELSHQWFGNLVTMQWWDDLWLNEAFATWIAYKMVDQWQPQWRMWDDFEQGKHAALRLDALGSTHPIRCQVLNANQATENFDAITYEKGAAMLRMIEGFLGEGAFQQGIRAYMAKYRFGNTVADDLWTALGEASGQPVAEIADAWLGREGYPLLHLAREDDRVVLSQERFMLDPQAVREVDPWMIPVVLAYEDDQGVKTHPVLLREKNMEIKLKSGGLKWVCGNARGAGFYRVLYQDTDLYALRTHFASLGSVEAVNLLSDTWAAFRSGRIALLTFLELLQRAADAFDYAIAAEVASCFASLEQLCVTESSSNAFRRWVSRSVAPVLERVGWIDLGYDDHNSLLRAAALRSIAVIGRQDKAIAELSARSQADIAGREPLDPNLLDVAWMVVARTCDEAHFDRLREIAITNPDPAIKRRALVSLAAIETPELQRRVIGLILEDDVPMQDATTYFNALVTNRSLRQSLWAFVASHWNALRAKCAAPFLTRRLVEAFGGMLGFREPIEALFEERAEDLLEVPAALRQTREAMRLEEEVHSRGATALSQWLEIWGRE